MPETTWTVIDCPDCSGKFKAPSDSGPNVAVACPSCGAEIELEQDFDLALDLGTATEAPVSSSHLNSNLPPTPEKSVSIDVSNLLVRDSNQTFRPATQPEAKSSPQLDNLDRLARTSDDAYAAVEEGPRERVSSSRARKEIVGWDEEGSEEDRDSSRSTVASTFKLALFALPLIIGVTIFALNAKSKKLGNPRPPMELAPEVAEPEKEPEAVSPESVVILHASLGTDEFYDQIVETIENFMTAENIEERLPFTRNPERVRPMMEAHYQSNADGPIEFRKIAPKQGVVIERGFAVLSMTLPNFEQLPIVIARSGDSLVVDWEAFVGYSEMSFEEFKEKKPTQPVLFRVRANPEDYYNYGFDERRHYCMSFSNLDLTKKLYGYIPKNSNVAEEIFSVLAKQKRLDFVIVKLRFPPDPKTDNQVIVDEFVVTGWLIDQAEE